MNLRILKILSAFQDFLRALRLIKDPED